MDRLTQLQDAIDAVITLSIHWNVNVELTKLMVFPFEI